MLVTLSSNSLITTIEALVITMIAAALDQLLLLRNIITGHVLHSNLDRNLAIR